MCIYMMAYANINNVDTAISSRVYLEGFAIAVTFSYFYATMTFIHLFIDSRIDLCID